MNIIGAIVAGLVGTIIISMVMMMAPKMGMPKMAIWEMLGAMFSPDGNVALGWAMHLMMGIVFGLIYAALWAAGLGSVSVVSGLIFGIVHWLVAGLMMGGMPMMHAGIKAGAVSAPGVFMLKNGGMMGFMGGLMGHAIFGVVVALVYGLFV
jgi:hypothetical protein